MSVQIGSGDFKYEAVDVWPTVPKDSRLIETPGVAADSHGDIYVGEVSYTIRGSRMNPPKELRSLSRLRKLT